MRLNPAAVTARGSHDEVYAAFGPPRSGKSNWLATVGLEAPGACLFTSTRADLAVHTAAARARKGPVWFLNPGLDGGFPSDLSWSPLAGCRDYKMAMEAAGALMHASPRNTDGSANWIDGETKRFLQYLLHAAALGGGDIFTVRSWAEAPHDVSVPVKVLETAGNPSWAGALEAMSVRASVEALYLQGLAGGVAAALGWLDDLALEAAACPAPGMEFDACEFIREHGTVYLIGADSPNCALSPYFACFATYLWNMAKRMAADPAEEASADLKLDPRLFMVIDEPAITCPVPLDKWATEAAGHGIVLVTGFQSDAQLPQRFGRHGGQALEDIITVKLVFGGVTGSVALKASIWGGEQDTWDWSVAVRDDGSKVKTRQPRRERTFPPERICNLPLGKVFVKHRNTRGFIAELGRVEDHPLYERADPAAFGGVRGPRRDAIAAVLLYVALARAPASPLPAPPRRAIAPPYRSPFVMSPPPSPVLDGPEGAVPALTVSPEEAPCPVAAYPAR